MNPFNKNPFATKIEKTKIVGNNVQFDENKKIENIKENMIKLKLQNNNINELNQKKEQPNLQEKIDFLRNIEK